MMEEIQEKEAEIERLKAKIKGLEKLNLMTDDEVVLDLKAEIERLKFLNAEERATIDELSKLCLRAADALETYPVGSGWNLVLIDQLRKAAQ